MTWLWFSQYLEAKLEFNTGHGAQKVEHSDPQTKRCLWFVWNFWLRCLFFSKLFQCTLIATFSLLFYCIGNLKTCYLHCLVDDKVLLRCSLCPLSLRCDCTEKLQSRFDFLRSQLNDISSFKNIYRYAFDFARVSAASPSNPSAFIFWAYFSFSFLLIF